MSSGCGYDARNQVSAGGKKIYREAQAYRRLSPTDRLLTLLDLIASGMAILEQSPQREAAESLREAQEAEWRSIQKKLFARHVS